MRSRAATSCAALIALAVCAAPASARDATVTSFDGTQINTHFYAADGLAPGEKAPTVLVGHGWGGEGDTDMNSASSGMTGNTGLGPLRNAGFNVVTWDARGFGKSGDRARVDSAAYEGRDVQALLDWLALQPEAQLENPGDPLVGMSGVSYGGAIQLVAAAIDKRVDAITPTITWNSLIRSLYRDGSVKQGWGTLLVGAGSSAITGGLLDPANIETGNLDPPIVQAFTEGLATGAFSPATVQYFQERGIDRLISQVKVPTLIVQGTADTLFTLQEGIDNYLALKANGVPARMVWFCGGHGICLTSQGAGTQLVEDSVIAWLQRHLMGKPVATGPAFEWIADDGVTRSSSAFPLIARPPLTGSGAGPLTVTPGSPATGISALIAAGPAIEAVNVDIAPPSIERELVGAPRVKITYSGTAVPASTHLYAQVLDTRTNRVLGNQVTPIPVTLDGQPHTIERQLEPIAVHASPASRYRLQVTAGTTVYGLQRSTGAVQLSRVEAALPVRAAVGADGRALRKAQLIVSKPKGLKRARRGRPVRVIVRARNAKVRRVRVVLRKRSGKAVGRSRRFAIGPGKRKVIKVRVGRRLAAGRYVARAAGKAIDGTAVRSARRVGRIPRH
jgi:ABC-2 type transport system ATP-binding protein